jgi:hypothetical protein
MNNYATINIMKILIALLVLVNVLLICCIMYIDNIDSHRLLPVSQVTCMVPTPTIPACMVTH